jgi:UDP-3-O-[3-hydroxymyristoyl] glucosamine N-acyltransferase
VGLSGSVQVGKRVSLAGQAGVVGHLVIGDDARIGARSVVTSNVPAGAYLLGHPATTHTVWKRAQVAWRRLPEILRRLRTLEGDRIPPRERREE